MNNKLVFFVTLYKQSGELVIQEGDLVNIKIIKSWQKPDPNVKSSALWVSHLPDNSLGINFVSLYPSKLIIKKRGITFSGILQPNGSNEGEKFYRCEMVAQIEQEQTNWGVVLVVFLLFPIAIAAVALIFFRNNQNYL